MTGEKFCHPKVRLIELSSNGKLLQFWFRSLEPDHHINVVHGFQVCVGCAELLLPLWNCFSHLMCW